MSCNRYIPVGFPDASIPYHAGLGNRTMPMREPTASETLITSHPIDISERRGIEDYVHEKIETSIGLPEKTEEVQAFKQGRVDVTTFAPILPQWYKTSKKDPSAKADEGVLSEPSYKIDPRTGLRGPVLMDRLPVMNQDMIDTIQSRLDFRHMEETC